MIQLPNDCYCGEINVIPANWRDPKASLKKEWLIHYRFYDPLYKDKPIMIKGKLTTFPKGMLRRIRGMNKLKNLKDRQLATEQLLKGEIALLTEEGFNPITGKFMREETSDPGDEEIKPTTHFFKAIWLAFEKMKTSEKNKKSCKYALNKIEIASSKLKYNTLEIQSIELRHIYLLLEKCAKENPRWSAQTFNHYRSYLLMIFKILRKLQVIKINPILEVEKELITIKEKVKLTEKQRGQIDAYLLKRDPDFRRYIHIFFHSGCRISELARVQGKDVDLDQQRFKILALKGRGAAREVPRPIRDLALPFWIEAMRDCGAEDYVFSYSQRPGKNAPDPQDISDKWRELIKFPKEKGGLGIDVDFYAYKHLNLDETAEEISEMQTGIKTAAAVAGHSTPVITIKHYAQGEEKRQFEQLKKIGRKLA